MSTTLQLPRAIEDALRSAESFDLAPRASSRPRARWSSASRSTRVPGGRALAQAVDAGPYPDPDFLQLDTWIVIHPNNTATFFVGKTDGGQGTGTAFRQMMCDELDMAYDQTSLVMGTTDNRPDQGGSGGSDGIERDGWPMRRVAAEARRVLLELGSRAIERARRRSHGERRHDRRRKPTRRSRSRTPSSSAASASTSRSRAATSTRPRAPRASSPSTSCASSARRCSATTSPARSTARCIGPSTRKCPACCTRATCGRRSPARR